MSAPWTVAEDQECRRLMAKAYDHGVLDGLVLDVKSKSSWDVVDPVSSLQMNVGSMTDASKRLRENDQKDACGAYVAREVTPPMVGLPTMMVPLPPGVQSYDHWGTCRITFGKLKKKSTYHELLMAKDPDAISYKAWLANHYAGGSAELKDLVNYMKALNDPTVVEHMPVSIDQKPVYIPGTQVRREFVP